MLEPGAFKDVNPSTLSGFISGLFNLLIAVAVVLAVLMIIIGGFQYMTTDSWQKKSDGLQKVKDAFIGLGMALLAYLILWTINPCLVEFSGGKGCSETNKIIQLK